ncbi:hypothetical protein CXB51_013608 [Gossypium anomalum]|uniref:DUF7745 domain-containing protein n=1 Tax=Gossypium anomalum TaxID=47600 RepID=A0A8J5YQ82_9ROSI|nr:hypothetical protein CXB51_013608 [Gossypium anomalum]
MIVVVTPLTGSEKLRLHEVFASVHDSGSLSGYIRTYGIDSRSVSKLRSFVMENGLLDRVEGNADVHRWSEQTHLEKGDSITMGYVSELSDYTRINITQNNLQELKEIWDQWGNETKRCFTFGEVDLVPTVEEYTALLCCPRALGYVDEATTDLFHRLSKRVTSVPAILAETFSHFRLIDGIVCRVFFENYSPLKDIVASSRKVDVPEENWIALLRNVQVGNVEWRAPWMVPGEIFYQCGSFDWVPLLGIWGAIGYAHLLVLRQHGLRQFVPVTHGLAQSEFVYRGADYKRKVSEVSSAWNKIRRLKGVVVGPITTPEYVEWRSRRINDNVPITKMEKARPIEEYL